MSNLLVVDFDFFFHNPMESGEHQDDEFWLYDWGHSESPLHIDSNIIWPSRALGFIHSERPLPQVDVPDGWWDRFNIDPDSQLYVADSNAYAGLLYDQIGDPFEQVWLFDAHHDLYKFKTPQEVAAWHSTGQDITCENWMFKHLMRGAELHWRYPRWHQLGPDMAESLPDWIGLDAAYDDGKPMDVEFDTIFLCRSGAWVPPWCDERFMQFMEAAPTDGIEQMDDYNLLRENWKDAVDMWVNAEREVTA